MRRVVALNQVLEQLVLHRGETRQALEFTTCAFRGEGGTDEWNFPLKFSVTQDRLSIHRRGFPDKEFRRVGKPTSAS